MLHQENKTDYNSLIGFALIGIVLFWFLNEQAKVEEVMLQNVTEEVQTKEDMTSNANDVSKVSVLNDSSSYISSELKEAYGAFSGAASKEDISEKFYLENDLIKVEVAAKGARVTSVYLKEYQTHDSLPLNLLREDSSRFNFTFWAQNRRLQTSDFVFDASQTLIGDKQHLSMRMNVSEGKYLEFSYDLAPNSYKVEYAFNLVGLDGVIEQNTPIELD
ncbi:MAG: YidC/Oxa1 family insertase periplasmic-domain containing protein, partial [Flavobacteriales bacterium]|nr:YidC/Oxa1 family insertase periplasmic-domain containing protein [Flavobacteriales bacterium]